MPPAQVMWLSWAEVSLQIVGFTTTVCENHPQEVHGAAMSWVGNPLGDSPLRHIPGFSDHRFRKGFREWLSVGHLSHTDLGPSFYPGTALFCIWGRCQLDLLAHHKGPGRIHRIVNVEELCCSYLYVQIKGWFNLPFFLLRIPWREKKTWYKFL